MNLRMNGTSPLAGTYIYFKELEKTMTTEYISDEEVQKYCVSGAGPCQFLKTKTSRKGKQYLYCQKYKKPTYYCLHLCEWDRKDKYIAKSFDMLESIFIYQRDLQLKLNTFPDEWDEQYIKDMVLAAQVELTEILNETPWKPWKKQQDLHPSKYKEEIADLLHFVINLCLVARMTPKELYGLYVTKHSINKMRILEDY